MDRLVKKRKYYREYYRKNRLRIIEQNKARVYKKVKFGVKFTKGPFVLRFD
jgi:hypothetical protein